MIQSTDTENSAFSQDWLENIRIELSHLPLSEHDIALRTLIADWSRRHTGGERLATNPAWESFNTFIAEDRAADKSEEANS